LGALGSLGALPVALGSLGAFRALGALGTNRLGYRLEIRPKIGTGLDMVPVVR